MPMNKNREAEPHAAPTATAGVWSRLPTDLLSSILYLLTLDDAIRFGAVCKDWRSAFSAFPKEKLRRRPWLMIPDRNSRTNTFLSPAGDKYYKIRPASDNFYDHDLKGSSNGWLITRCGRTSEFRMVNPHTGAEFALPPITAEISQHPSFFRMPIVVPSSSSGGEGYSVALITADLGRLTLAVAQAGGDRWTLLDTPPPLKSLLLDLNYDKGLLYAVCCDGNVAAWDLSSGPTPLLKLVVPSPGVKYGEIYIVPGSPYGLLLIARYRSRPSHEVKVFALDPIKGKWVEIKCLEKCSLILGSNHQSMYFSERDWPVLKEKKGIYFTDDLRLRQYCQVLSCHDLGFYNLQDGRYDYMTNKEFDSNNEEHDDGDGSFEYFPDNCLPPVWVVPNLK